MNENVKNEIEKLYRKATQINHRTSENVGECVSEYKQLIRSNEILFSAENKNIILAFDRDMGSLYRKNKGDTADILRITLDGIKDNLRTAYWSNFNAVIV